MTQPVDRPATSTAEPTLGALVHDLSAQIPELIRSELRLAQAELSEKGKQAGVGLGMFSAAGLLAFFGLATLVVSAILGLAEAIPAWLAALLVAAALLATAGVLAIRGRSQVAAATPVTPARAVEGMREDVATLKGQHR